MSDISNAPNASPNEPRLTLDRAGVLFDAQAALQARLEYAFPRRQFAHHIVPARFSRATWNRVGQTSPFVCLGFSGIVPPEDVGRRYNGRAVWHVFVGVRQPRNDAQLVGDARSPGLLGMLGLGTAALHGFTVPDCGTFMCAAVQNMYDESWAEDDLAVIGIEVGLKIELVDDGIGAAVPGFERAAFRWFLPDLPGTHIVTLPGAPPATETRP